MTDPTVRPLSERIAFWAEEARAITQKYAPGELGLTNYLARRFAEIEHEKCARHVAVEQENEKFRCELSARVACSSPDGSAELGIIDELIAEVTRLRAQVERADGVGAAVEGVK